MANNRIYYAIQQVKIGGTAVHGLQSVGITTNFNLEQVFEIGQLAIYQNVENVPDIEVTLNKVLDGYPLIYTMATENGSPIATGPTIPGRQNARADLTLSIFSDSKLAASGLSQQLVNCSGMYVSSVTYTFPVDGQFTEDVTLVGNNKIWSTGISDGSFTNDDKPASSVGVARRQFLNMTDSVFPTQIPGINGDGKNAKSQAGIFGTHFQNITVSCDFGREQINELGRLGPYFRYVTFPVEVTSEFEILANNGDSINAAEEGYYIGLSGTSTGSTTACEARHNLNDEKIFLATCEGTKIHLGEKNKLTSVNYAGGDTGGGNVTVTYSYTTYNDLVVAHSGSSAPWYNSLTASNYKL